MPSIPGSIPTATSFALIVHDADRFTRNGATTYVFYVIPTSDAGPLKGSHRYILMLTEKQLHHDLHQALVALARPGHKLYFDVDNLSLSKNGEIWFEHINSLSGRPLGVPVHGR